VKKGDNLYYGYKRHYLADQGTGLVLPVHTTPANVHDGKLYKKVIKQCMALAKRCGIKLRQSYRFVVQRLTYAQRYAHLPKHAPKAKRALKKLRTIAGRQVRNLHRQLLA
jgi:IS5 family transposase